MRKSLVYLACFIFAIFLIACASKSTEKAEKKAEPVKEEAKVAQKEEAKAEKPAEEAAQQAATEQKTSSDLTVESAAIAKNIENLTPLDSGTEFTKDTDRIYCFSKITGAQGETNVKHLWYHNGELSAEIELPVKSNSWRSA